MAKRRKRRGSAPLRATTPAATMETFSKWVEAHDGIDWIFRGVSDRDYKLRPKIGRPKTRPKGYLPQHEKWVLDEFRRMAPAYLSLGAQPMTRWDWLALAQHHGLPTRLLDWSCSPLVAAYFAVESEGKNGDAVIYAYKPVGQWSPESTLEKDDPLLDDPFLYPGIVRFDPPNISPRIVAQAAIFTIHPNPTMILRPREGRLHRLIIAKHWCGKLKSRLNNLGVNRAALFPDLDGVSVYLTWLNTIVVDKIGYPFRQPDLNVEGNARKVVEQYGPKGPDFVRSQIKQVRDGGDTEMVAVMKGILKAVEKLLDTTPPGDQSAVH